MKRRFVALLALGLAACSGESPDLGALASAAPPVTQAAVVAAPSTTATIAPASQPALSLERWRELVTTVSEPDSEFFSDNYVSNETSYLQVAEQLPREAAKNGAYLGVGPEQNFSYIAMTEPRVAFLIDIRRDNLRLHLLYKAAFELARSRAELVALVCARDYDAAADPGPNASVADVLGHVRALGTSPAHLGAVHERLMKQIESYGLPLDDADRRALARIQRAFHEQGLDLAFTLETGSFRKYPTFGEILAQRAPDGAARGFLASEASFRAVQTMQRENRIVPLVGDFAGDRALPRLAEHLLAEKLTVSSFYVSNVEQYLLADGKWWNWRRNIAALPTDERSLFIRAYLDQGKAHPRQMNGHRTATTLQRISAFNGHDKPYPSMLALASDAL